MLTRSCVYCIETTEKILTAENSKMCSDQKLRFNGKKMKRIFGIPAKREKTLHAGIGVNEPTAKARTSAKLASVIEGPTSASASPTRVSSSKFRSWRFNAFTKMHILSTPTCNHRKRMFKVQLTLYTLYLIAKEINPGMLENVLLLSTITQLSRFPLPKPT